MAKERAATREKSAGLRSRRGRASGSLLLSRTRRASFRCVDWFRNGPASRLFCSADRVDEASRTGFVARLSRTVGFRETVSGPLRTEIASGACESRLFALAGRLRRAFLHTRVRFFGIAGIVFALYTVGVFLAKRFLLPDVGEPDALALCTAALTLVASVPLLFFGKPINVSCAESLFFRRFFIESLGFDPEGLRQGEDRVTARGGIAFVAGTLAGLATVWFAPHRVLLFLAAALFCFCVPATPECGLLAAVFLLPFAPLRWTGCLTLLTVFGYLQKYFRLKRAFRVRLPEVLLLLLLAACGLSAVTAGDGYAFIRMLLFACIWVLTVCMLTTETLGRAFHAVLVYGGVVTLALSALRMGWSYVGGPLSEMFPGWNFGLPAAVYRLGLSGTVLGCYLAVLLPVVLARGRCRSGAVALLLIAVDAVLLRSAWTVLGLLLAVLLYAVFAHGAPVGAALTGCVSLPAAVLLLGDRLGPVLSGFSPAAGVLVKKYFLTGVGAGDGALAAAALANGIFPDGFAAGLYTRLLLDGGAATLLLFFGCAFCALQRLFTCMRRENDRERTMRFGGIAASVPVFLLTAWAVNVWADLRLLGVFWCLCALSSLTGNLYGYGCEREAGETQWI